MKCPLHDAKGNPRTLASIDFEDFEQLKEIEEGYAVEYKSTWDDAVKAKIQKIVTSFANANGGWLFVGINNDGSYAGIVRNRTDFDQTIAQIIHRHVTPLPRFETRYIGEQDTDKGVLVMEILEGLEPPYISDGSVYVRVGSSSERFVSKADSYVLIDLHRKARQNISEIEKFCHRTVFFPPTWVKDDVSVCNLPVYDLYLKRLHPERRSHIPFAEFDEAEKRMLEIISESHLENFICQHSHRSLIFRSNFGNNVDDVSPIIELFYDGSIKINLPLFLVQSPNIQKSIEHLQSIRSIRNENLIRIIDGDNSKNLTLLACSAVDRYIAAMGRKMSDYAISYEFENIEGSIIEFNNSAYDEYSRLYGFPFFGGIDERIEPQILEGFDDETMQLTLYAMLHFFEGFGMPFATADETLSNHVLEIIGMPKMEEGTEYGRNQAS